MPEPPSQLSVDSVQGSVVSLSWNAPAGPTPDGYVLEGGFAPSGVAGSLALGNGSTATQVALPPGMYFIRAYAVENGRRSAASNEVQVGVGIAAIPAVPEDFTAVAVGPGVVLGWRQPFSGGTPDQVLLEVSGPVSGNFPLAATGEFRVDGVPNGTYTMRLRAAGAGGVSGPTPALTLTLPGRVVRVEQGPSLSPVEAGLPVRYEQFDAPRIQQLASREALEGVVAGAANEFEAVLKLKDWVAAQFPHTTPDPYPPWDALTVLDMIRGGLTGGFCAQYSQVLLQSLAALGYPARYVEVGTTTNPYNHYPLEYWSNQFNKWVLLDADFNLHFERNGRPLSALDVHDALVSGTEAAVEVVEGSQRTGHPSPADWPLQTKELYYYLRYHLKANHVTNSFEHAQDRWNDMVEWTDSRTTPWEMSAVPSQFAKEPLTARTVSDAAVAEAPVNQIWVTPRVTTAGTVEIDLAHNMPQIVGAQFRVIDDAGQPGPWQPHGSPTLVWQVGASDRAIEVRGVNLLGVAGPASRVGLVAP